jgi:very-short-patch-repair endonuclease
VRALLARQHNLARRAQLVNDLGHARGAVDGWIQRGHLEVRHRGVVGLADRLATPQQALLARVFRVGTGGCADGAASLALHELTGFKLRDHSGVLIPAHREVTGVSFPVRKVRFQPGMTARIRKVPALAPGPAAIDAAAVVSPDVLRQGVDDAFRRDVLQHGRLLRWADKLADHPGAAVVLDLFAAGTFEQENDGERALAAFLKPLGLNLEWGVTDLVPGRRLDALCRALLLVIESDSRAYHLLPTDRDADGLRDLECEAIQVDGRSLKVVRITTGMVRDHPQATLERLANLVEQRRRELIGGRRAHRAS